MKPVLQAVVIADSVYEDKTTGKKIIAGTFNCVVIVPSEHTVEKRESEEGDQELIVRGGMNAGSPCAYISLTDVCDGTELTLQFVSLRRNIVFLEQHIVVPCDDRLKTIEIIAPLPPLPILEEGTYALEVVCEGAILGSHRIRAIAAQ